MDLKVIGDNIKRYRELREISVDDLSEKSGVGRANIYNWEGNKHKPDLIGLIDLSKALGITLNDLVMENSTPVQDLSDNKENTPKGDPEVYRIIVEGNTEYVLIPRIAMENAEIVSKKQLDASIKNMDSIVNKLDSDSKIMQILVSKFVETVEKVLALPNPVQPQKRKDGV